MRMSLLSIFRLFLIDLRKLLRFIETLNFVKNRKVVQGKKHLLYTSIANLSWLPKEHFYAKNDKCTYDLSNQNYSFESTIDHRK